MKRIGSLLVCFFVLLPSLAAAAQMPLLPVYHLLLGSGDPEVVDPGSLTLTVNTIGNGAGIITKNPARFLYVEGEVVTLTATASTGSNFIGWSGEGCSGTGNCVVTLNDNVTVSAEFELVPEPLTVSITGAGSGSVTSSPSGITCVGDCEESYDYGTIVTLTASVDDGSAFMGWSGDVCSGTGDCVLPMLDARNVTAEFQPLVLLTVTPDANGTITSAPSGINCGDDCEESYGQGAEVTLTAVGDIGFAFTGWSGGGCNGTTPCKVIMDQATTVTATFEAQLPPSLSVATSGDGTGSVSSSPAGITCGTSGSDCGETYEYGTVVTLTPTATTGYFNYWSGDCSGTGTCVVTMTETTSVTANFGLLGDPQQLIVLREGTGIVTSEEVGTNDGIDCGNNCSEDYLAGTSVTLNASADGFIRWEDADGVTLSANPQYTFTMPGTDLRVNAVFEQLPEIPEVDTYPYNNEAATANAAQLDAVILGKLGSYADQDWFKVYAASDQTVTVRFNVNNFESDERWRVLVFRGDKAVDDPDAMLTGITVGGNDSFSVYLPWRMDYYFAVVAEEADSFALGANYELTLLSVANGSVGAMESESNDAWNIPDSLALDTTINGHLMDLNDQDWYKMTVDTDKTATVAFDGNSYKNQNIDWIVTVYFTPEGSNFPDLNTPIARVAVGNVSEFHIQMLAAKSPYYFVVEENLDMVGSEERWNGEAYTLNISEYSGDTVSEFEPNNSDTAATDVGSFIGSMTMSGQLLDENDVDWFRFDVASGQTVTVDVSFNVPDVGAHWRIFLYKDSNLNTPLNTGDWFPTYGFDGQTFTGNLDTAGTYYFKVLTDATDVNLEGYSSAEYTISVQ